MVDEDPFGCNIIGRNFDLQSNVLLPEFGFVPEVCRFQQILKEDHGDDLTSSELAA